MQEAAADPVFELAYEQLRSLAQRERRKNPVCTLNTTALVHETWLRCRARHGWANRDHFMATAALAMRQVLVDYARRQRAQKRTRPDEDLIQTQTGLCRTADEIIELDEALMRLASLDQRLVHLVELRFFGGLSMDEAASCLKVSVRTAARDWQKARAFLKLALDT